MPSNYVPPKTTITLKVANRRVAQPPTPDLSGDEGYSALEELSGESDDDDDENVYAAEEEHFIDLARTHSARSPRPVSDVEEEEEDEDDAAQDADDDGDDEEEDDVVDDDDEEDVYENDDGDDESKSWNGIVSDESDTEGDLNSAFAAIHSHIPQSERHVRFANVPDSDSDSTDTDDDHADMFPDIFVDQAALDPAIRREIDRDPEESSGSGSFWDFQGGYDYSSADSDTDMFLPIVGGSFTAPPSDEDITPMATPMASFQTSTAPASEVSSPTKTIFTDLPVDLDGYETDGDTTEEDIPEPIVRKKSRRPDPVDDGGSDSDCALVKSNRGKPRVGRFNLDKSDKKPIAVLNPITRKMMIFTPHRHRQLDLSPEQFNFAFYSSVETSSPGVNGGGDGAASSSTYMLDTMFASNTFGDFMNGQDLGDLGDVDAFLQGALMSEANTLDSFDSDLGADEGEKALDINDFITFADGASESESEQDPWTADAGSTPGAPARDSAMLSHLSSATVGAFRQNQITQQLIFSNKATQDSLAFSGPFNDTALRGMKSDRLATAGTPLTPVRRRRKSSVHEPQQPQPPTSPLETITQKRKATGDHEGHKRHRSISDMSMLQV